jgi:NADH-quinone oxidoreductase subunit D
MKEFETLLNRNRIFMDRCIGAGPISAERALNYGFTGPNLRATGVDYDVRVAMPYSSYEDFDFKIPTGTVGDVYDRYMVRNDEIWESVSIIKQALEKIKKIENDFPEQKNIFYAPEADKFHLPPKEDVYTKMEALIYHFKIIMGEIDAPAGEVYHSVEGGNGELGFYLISDGGRTPYRLHFRRPCFIYYQAYPEMVEGGLLSDAVIALSSLNVIAGELDA